MLGVGGGASGTGFGGPMALPQDPTGNANLSAAFNQMQGVANGTGPNPAMAQYNQNVQDLAKQQSGAISSIQGISPALAARLASQQGSAAMQNAAAQGASTQAQQQLGAMGQMGNIAGQQAGIAAGMQQNVNNVNAGLAGNQMGAQQGMTGGLMSGFGSISSFAGGAGKAVAMASGGEVHNFAGGGPISQFGQFLNSTAAAPAPVSVAPTPMIPQVSGFDKGLGGYGKPGAQSPKDDTKKPKGEENQGQGPTQQAAENIGAGIPYAQPTYSGFDAPQQSIPYDQPTYNTNFAKGGSVPAMLSPGETYIPPGKVKQAAQSPNPLAAGRKIPGTPKVPGNSYANDVVPQRLDVGGIVIPNAIMQSDDPAGRAHAFISNIIAKRRARG